MTIPTIDQLKRAVEISERIAALESEMSAILGGQAAHSAPAPAKVATTPEPTKKTRKISAAHRAKLAAAAKARWAKANAGKDVPAAPSPEPAVVPAPVAAAPEPKKTGGLSEAGRRKLRLAMKRRWAAAKAGTAPAPTASTKG